MNTRTKKNIALVGVISIAVIFLIIYYGSALSIRMCNQVQYDTAISMIDNGQYRDAIDILYDIQRFKDAKEYLLQARIRYYIETNRDLFSETISDDEIYDTMYSYYKMEVYKCMVQ